MSGYTREQQIEDIAIIDRTSALLSARLAGERQSESESMLPDYVRIARYFAVEDDTRRSLSKQISVARMFREFVELPKISAFKIGEYQNLLREVRQVIRAKLIRRRRKMDTCFNPDIHTQPCYCANLARAQGKEDFGNLQGEERELRRVLLSL